MTKAYQKLIALTLKVLTLCAAALSVETGSQKLLQEHSDTAFEFSLYRCKCWR